MASNKPLTKGETMKSQVQVNCPKCDGRGHIQAFGHVANGVCFCCKGARKITVDLNAKRAELSDYVRRCSDWVMQSTAADYAKLSYGKLFKIRDFCHGGFGLQEAYPELLSHYREVGEPAFQAAQERKLAAFYG